MSSPRSAMTSDFPVRYTLIKSFMSTFDTLATPHLEHSSDVHPSNPPRHEDGGPEHRHRREDQEQQPIDGKHEETWNDGLLPGEARDGKGDGEISREQADCEAHDDADEHDRHGFPNQEAGRLPSARTAGRDSGKFDGPFKACCIE